MKIIVITGPSGSGKSYLANKLGESLGNCIIINTDSYYRDNIFIKFIGFFLHDIYDRLISIKRNEIKNTIFSIYNNKKHINFYNYNFLTKRSKLIVRNSQIIGKTRFIIIEGIFAHRLDLNYQNYINIMCIEDIDICYKRRLKRDMKERGRNEKEVNNRFLKSWKLYFHNIERYNKKNKTIQIKTDDKILFRNLLLIINQ